MAQNVLYLAMLLQRLPGVEPIMVLSDDAELIPTNGFQPVRVSDAINHLDILIEIGVRFEASLMQRFRAAGGKLISYMAGNAMVMNLEALANNNDNGEIPAEVGFDAVWLTPQHMRTNAAYAALTRSPVVREAPHIWHPSCLTGAIDAFGAQAFFWKRRPECEPWRIGVFDPTINVVKTFHLPLLVCEQTERQAPGLLSRVLLFGAQRFTGNPHFAELVGALDLGRQGKVFAEQRHPLPSVLGRHVDAVVTHQWENALNYLFWDVLYSGRPLIHNVSDLGDAGYRYLDFDPADGGRVLADALHHHRSRRDTVRSAELEVLWRFSIDNPAVQRRHEHLILEAMETQP